MIKDREGNYKPVSQFDRRDNVYAGRYGETVADRHMASQGYNKISDGGVPSTMDGPFKGPGKIDGVYHKPGGNPPYVIADSKFSKNPNWKFNPKVLQDGSQQMDKDWIGKRLADEFGPDRADEIIRDGYDPKLLKVDKDGNVTEQHLGDFPWRTK